MLAVDVIVGVVIAGAVAWGFAKGLVTLAPLLGITVGVVLGTRVPLLGGDRLDSDFALVVALPAALLFGALLGAAAERFGLRFTRRLRRHATTDAVGGALLAGAAAVVAVWVLGPVAAQVISLRDPIDRSTILAQFNRVLTPAGPSRDDQPAPATDDLPNFAGPPPPVAATDPRSASDADVKVAERSVVKIGVLRCDSAGQGSGWFAAAGIVVTNAHVVVSADAITVRLRGTGPPRPATAIWFDRVNDIALLRVPRLRDVRPLAMVARPRTGTSGAALGFPKGVKTIASTRLGATTRGLRGRLGGERPGAGFRPGLAGRLVTPFRGKVRPGNSGGPLVDLQGRVLTTVFAQIGLAGGAGVPNRFVREALRKAGPAVSTGGCHEHRSG